ncbi:MAG: hypothetical protein AABM29_08825 [Actinomycetota bacterium]
MDLTRLTQGEKIAAVSGVLLFIFMFFAWFGLPSAVEQAAEQANQIAEQFGAPTVDTGSVTASAWESFSWIDLLLFLTVIAAVTAAVLKGTGSQVEMPTTVIVTVLGGLSTLFVLYRVIDPIGDASRKLGLFLGLLASAGVAIGGYMAMQEEGTSFGEAADRLGGGDGPGDTGDRPSPSPSEPPSAPPPPPPPPPSSGGAPPSA